MSYSGGMIKTSHISDANRMKRVVDEQIYEPDRDLNPFLYLCNLNGETVVSPEYECMYRESIARQDTVGGAGCTDSATTIPVDIAGLWRVYDTAVNMRTREMVFCTGVDVSAGTVTVTRGIGNAGAAAAMVDDDVLALCGSAAPEGDTRLASVHSQPSFTTNNCQIHKATHSISNTNLNTAAYGPNQLMDDKDITERRYWMEKERCYLFGGRHKIAVGSDVIRFTGGLIPMLGAGDHVVNQSGTLSKTQLDAYLRPLFDYGNPRAIKVALINSWLATVFADLMEGYIEFGQNENALGWTVNTYNHPGGGKLMLKPYLTLSRLIPASGAMIVIDPDLVGTRTLQNRATKYHTASTDSNFVDGIIGEFIGEDGLMVKGVTANTSAHGFLYGVTAAAT
jgi:hypothetical protein